MASKKRRKAEPAPGWAWMLFGLSIGLAVALVVYLRSGQPGVPDLGPVTVASATPAEPADAQPNTVEPLPLPQPAADDAGSEAAQRSNGTELSFYEELRESTVDVNEGEFEFAADFDTPQDVIIQAGSFPSTAGADSRRANLAFLGFESRIEQAIVNGRTFHRVIVGPFSDPGEINRTLRRLRNERIETVLRVVSN